MRAYVDWCAVGSCLLVRGKVAFITCGTKQTWVSMLFLSTPELFELWRASGIGAHEFTQSKAFGEPNNITYVISENNWLEGIDLPVSVV